MFILIPISFAAEFNLSDDNINNLEEYNDIGDLQDNVEIPLESNGNEDNGAGDFEILQNEDEIHVDIHGNDDNSGDYDHPLLTINKALNISKDNSRIVIHEGVYKENNLNITKSLEIQGQGNVVIDAENKSRIFTINTASSGEVILSGITFINGNAYQGGAIYVRGAVTTIDNSKFISNYAVTEGGAIYWNADYGRLTNTVVENNYARSGSGVTWGEYDSSLSIGGGEYGQIINCTFVNNHLMQDGDACIGLAIYSDRSKVINSTFSNHKTLLNSSFEVVYINGDYATVEGCKFINNEMTLAGALGFDGNFAIAFNNSFINNSVSFADSFGGAIGIQSENANIYNNTFINNGGKNCIGGAIFINTVETFSFNFINVTNNLFVDNNGNLGGCVYANGNTNMLTLKINDNTFNQAKATNGAGIYLVDIYNPVEIKNNNFTDSFSQYGAGIYAFGCILDISKNSIFNCTSALSENIYTNGEVKGIKKLKFNDIKFALGQQTNLTAILLDDMGNSITASGITFNVNGTEIKGKNIVKYSSDTFGVYVISGKYDYDSSVKIETGVLSVLYPVNLNLVCEKYYGKNVKVEINLTNASGNPITNAYIIVNFGENDILLKTDENGIAKINTQLNHGKYNVNIRFDDDSYYKSANFTSTIEVLQSIVVEDMTRAYNSGMDFKAKLFNSDGSLLKNTNVVFNVNGKKYSVMSDLNGIAKLNVKLNVGKYSVSLTNPNTGDESYNVVNIVKRITNNKNINVYFTSAGYYKVRITGDDGKFVGAGEIVSIKVNGVIHKIKTDKNGYASFKINLNPKTYTVTAQYKGFKVSNKIVVKPLLTAKNLSKKKAKKIKFTAKLVNNKGKVVKGKKITFKIKGKTYKAKTNKKGIATIYIKNLKVGKYTIKTSYAKSVIKNTIKIKR